MSVSAEILNKYQLVVGLEVHAQLKTHSKAYAPDKNEYGALPNTLISPITLGHPGTLPRLNRKVVELAIKLGLATHCEIARTMHFARKNYFYADLPKGYQITQDTTPICTGGHLVVKDAEGKDKRIGITRIHMEEDAGKSIHDIDPYNTLVDLNRAGVPLLEIVSEPDIRSIEEAYNYLFEVRKILRYLDVCDGNMEEGSMRCDANVSVMLKGSSEFGNRCEVKNMNSMRNVQRAIEHEMTRQIAILEAGGRVDQETRSFDAVTGTTFTLRSKEDAHDYRYFPEPDLQPLQLSEKQIEAIREALPALPQALLQKYTEHYGLSEYDAAIITENREMARYFEALLKEIPNAKTAANWLNTQIRGYINERGLHIDDFPLSAAAVAGLVRLIEEGKISHSVAAQNVFPALVEQPGKSPLEIASDLNLLQESDSGRLEAFAREALAAFPDKVAAYKAGNKGLIGLFMGDIMKRSQRKADPKATNEILLKLLDE